MKLNELAPAPGSRKARKRVGRGIGSGVGKTSGKGHKGQRARSGTATRTFEGGQMPIYRRLPKRGFKNPFRKEYTPLNLDRLQAAVEAGRLDPAQTLDGAALKAAGVIGALKDGVRLLARGELKTALTLQIDSASKAAHRAIAQAGGKLLLPDGSPMPAPEGDPDSTNATSTSHQEGAAKQSAPDPADG